MNKELKQQAHKEFELVVGITSIGETNEEHQKRIRKFIDSIIDKTVQMTEERIVGLIKERKDHIYQTAQRDAVNPNGYDYYRIMLNSIDDIISLITNNSDINKDKE